MAGIGQKLETKGVIMALLSLVLISTGCEEQIDPPAVNPSEGETVEVTLNLGIADEEDGAGTTASPTSKAGSNGNKAAFEVLPVSDVQTKSATDIPDKLYNLEVWQYNGENPIGGNKLGNITVGSTITASLTQATGCKLLLYFLSGKLNAPLYVHIWFANNAQNSEMFGSGLKPNAIRVIPYGMGYGWPVRCIQQ